MARVICPACKKPGSVPDQHLGHRIKCPSCGERFLAPTLPPPSKREIQPTATAAPPPAERAAAVEVVSVGPPPLMAHIQISPASPPELPQKKRCVYCGEEIQAVALKCRHCGEILDPALRAAEEAKTVARQQTAAGVNVSTTISNVVGVRVPHRVLSRLIPVGLVFFFGGMGITLSGASPGSGAALFGVGVILMAIGSVVSIVRAFLGMFG
jgi:predicted RNA-binding Zn-ribbon protein involved in translation (DUF1610 family)/DNA-directed RNA polymerase subunit RPC12/RpoP